MMKKILGTLSLAVLAAASAHASPILPLTITLDNPNQTITPGGTIQFFATITNNTGSTIDLGGDDPTLAGYSLTLDDLFFENSPASIAPNSNSGDFELFDVTASNPLLDSPGTYLGTYEIMDPNNNLIGEASFSVTTVAASAVTPEPSSLILALTGFSTAATGLTRRLRRA